MATASGDVRKYRLTSIDVLRGLAIVIMAIDHVRDNFLAGAFRIRWPIRTSRPAVPDALDHPLLRAGRSSSGRHERGPHGGTEEPGELGRFLFTRGVWLVFVEMAVISTLFTFAPGRIAHLDGPHIDRRCRTIWAIGASMIVLAGAQFLGRRAAS